jgi:hypothetical protein
MRQAGRQQTQTESSKSKSKEAEAEVENQPIYGVSTYRRESIHTTHNTQEA